MLLPCLLKRQRAIHNANDSLATVLKTERDCETERGGPVTFWPHVPCVWAASRKPHNANVRIAGVRPGSSRESSSPRRNSLGFSSVLLNGFHFTTAIKDQYAGRYNDPISLLLAKDKVLHTGISPQKDNWHILKYFLFQSMQLAVNDGVPWCRAETVAAAANVYTGNSSVGLCRVKVSGGFGHGWLVSVGVRVTRGLRKLRSTVSLVCERTAITSTCGAGARSSRWLSSECTLGLHEGDVWWRYSKSESYLGRLQLSFMLLC